MCHPENMPILSITVYAHFPVTELCFTHIQHDRPVAVTYWPYESITTTDLSEMFLRIHLFSFASGRAEGSANAPVVLTLEPVFATLAAFSGV